MDERDDEPNAIGWPEEEEEEESQAQESQEAHQTVDARTPPPRDSNPGTQIAPEKVGLT